MTKRALEVTDPRTFHQWLMDNVGGPGLPGLYVRQGQLVRVPRIGTHGYVPLTSNPDEGDGPAQVRQADAQTIRAVIERHYQCFKLKRQRNGNVIQVEVLPPLDPIIVYLAGINERGNVVPQLKGVVHTPFIRPDGSVCSSPGYDPITRLLLLPPDGLVLPPIPDDPTDDDIAASAGRLLALVADFPFVSEDDRASYIGALLIGPMLRPLVPPPYPITAISAHMAGSGKTLLTTVARLLHGGVFRSEPSGRDEEIRKLVTSLLVHTTSPIIVLDNLMGTFKSGQFAAMATSATWSDRPLGATAHVEAPQDRLWVITGNNLMLGGDMPRRVPIWIRLDADCEDPHLRNGFAIPDLEAHVNGTRARLLADVMILVRAWVVRGRPLIGEPRHDSFGNFLRSVAGVLDVAGISGAFASAKVASEASPMGTEDDEAAEFLAAIHARFPNGFLSRDVASVLLAAAESRKQGYNFPEDELTSEGSRQAADLLDALPADLTGSLHNAAFGKSLGKWLTYRVGQWKRGRVLRMSEGHAGYKHFRVEVRG